MTTTFSISRGDLAKAITIALKFAGKDSTLPMLCGVDLSIIKRKLVISATDRFRIGVVRIDPNPDLSGPDGRLGFLTRDSATRLLRVFGAVRGGQFNVKVTVGERQSFTVSDMETSLTVTLTAEGFPDVAAILIREMENPIDLDLWSANSTYLAAFKDAAWYPHQHVSVRLSTPNRPAVVRIGDHFIGCLMPVRLTEHGEPAQDWKEFLTLTPEPAPAPEKPKRATRKAPAKKVPAKAAAKAPAKKASAKKAPTRRASRAAK